MTRTHFVVPSPIGPLTAVREDGALVGLFFELRGRPMHPAVLGPRSDDDFADVARELDEYFSGQRTAFDLLLRPTGTAFDRAVWGELIRIPYGETRSYGQVARAVGEPGAAQAVGAAN